MYGLRRETESEEAMFLRVADMPEEERCTACDGKRKVRIGCAWTHDIYAPCLACLGTGLRSEQVALAEAREHLQRLSEERKQES